MKTRRVQLADDALALFEQFMQMRFDLADGRFAGLTTKVSVWRKTVLDLANNYKEQYCFARAWAPETVGARFFSQFFQPTYEDATRIAPLVLLPRPVRSFRWKADPEGRGEQLGWASPAFDDRDWPTTDVCEQTWSSLGLHDYFKAVWYRADLGHRLCAPLEELPVGGRDRRDRKGLRERQERFLRGREGSDPPRAQRVLRAGLVRRERRPTARRQPRRPLVHANGSERARNGRAAGTRDALRRGERGARAPQRRLTHPTVMPLRRGAQARSGPLQATPGNPTLRRHAAPAIQGARAAGSRRRPGVGEA